MPLLTDKTRQNTVLIHVIVWMIILISISVLIFFLGNEKNDGFGYIVLQAITGFGIVLIPTIYFNTGILIPRLLTRKKYIYYVLSVVALAFVWGPIAVFLENWTDHELFHDDAEPVTSLAPGVYIVLLVILLSSLVNLSYKWFLQLNAITRMENERLNIELSLLRSQINPHFFFNTLNNLYSLSLENSAETPGVILKLSEMMRYTIYDCKSSRVPVNSEVQYLKNYISLQQIRLNSRGDIVFNVELQEENLQIAPMLLIVFLENAFKHGIEKMTDGAYIKIDLTAKDEILSYSVRNNYEHDDSEMNDGLGLVNVKRRLALIYPDRHQLEICKQNNEFAVMLTIEVN